MIESPKDPFPTAISLLSTVAILSKCLIWVSTVVDFIKGAGGDKGVNGSGHS